MHSTCFSSTLSGVEARLVAVESVVTSGLPGLTVVGLPDAAVSEAGARVRSALKLSGITLPPRRMVVNLSPADLRKSGSGFDLALALGLLEALGEIPAGTLSGVMVVGELSLAGEVRRVRGLVATMALASQQSEIEKMLFPVGQFEELPPWEGVELVPVSTLMEAIDYCRGQISVVIPRRSEDPAPSGGPDLAEVHGQEMAKLALELSAAGGHHLAMVGPPGCGKSLLASCLPGLLPPLSDQEQREVAAIASVCFDGGAFRQRPFRSPGVGVSAVALLGGYHPGEVTRAHHGVLFLDEFPEYRRDTLESLRLVLEAGEVNVARARAQIVYPARFTLVCAMNPCPCGKALVPGEVCRCPEAALRRYRQKLSGPLLDRFDLLVALQRVELGEIVRAEGAESSATVAQRVSRARDRQLARGALNRELRGKELRAALDWDQSSERFALQQADRSRMSLRAFEKWLKVARTVADLQDAVRVEKRHLLIAHSLRFSAEEELGATA